MLERKLAHIEKIINLEKIQNADKIERCEILGWSCVVPKEVHKVGDLVAFVEIDSIVPKIAYFEFMMPRKYRVKTIKLRKTISQGLVISMKDVVTIWNELHPTNKKIDKIGLPEGSDVTDFLGITKYLSPSERESEENFTAKKKHNFFIKFMTRFSWYRKLFHKRSKSFPEFLHKTDEERIQNMPWVCQKYKDNIFFSSEKVDGQSVSYWIKKKWMLFEYGICSRTVRKFEFDNSNWSKVFKQQDIKNKLKLLYKTYGNIAIQGEIIGSSIQGNKYNLPEGTFDLFIFNVFNIDKQEYYSFDKAIAIIKSIGLKYVPIINDNLKLPETVQELVDLSKGKSLLYNTDREGLVIRTYDKKVSFKVINPEFLLKENE